MALKGAQMREDGERNFAPGTKVLQMIIGEESRAKESRIGRRDSLLYECYLKSFEVLSETIGHAKRFYQHPNNYSLENYYTNVIVFDGARGRGKTSAMLTFGKALEGLSLLTQATNARDRKRIYSEVFDCPDDQLIATVENLGNSSFVVLPPIDPTILNKSHDLLTTFTARLYQMAQTWWESDRWAQAPTGVRNVSISTLPYEAKDAFLDDIKKCYLAISGLKDNDGPGTWSMSQLSKMGAASELSKCFQGAVCSLLKLNNMNPERSFVVLQIDDADMTFRNVYKILEDMRCFLKIPNLVVLMAADLTMIENLVRREFMEETKYGEDLIQEMTEQYMIKYFPLRRQVALPDLNDVLHHDVKHVGMRVWTDESRQEEFFSELYEEGGGALSEGNALCMSTTLLRMLFRRTGILLDDTKGYYPWLLPVSQRSLAGFVGLLHKMRRVKRLDKLDGIFSSDNVVDGLDRLLLYYPCAVLDDDLDEYVADLDNWLSNVRLLEYYLLHDWVLAALTHEEGVQFRKIAHSSIWDRRITTYKALEGFGQDVKVKYNNTKDFNGLTEALKEYKKEHGPRFSYAVRVLESLFAQEYILETLWGRFSETDLSENMEDVIRGDLYIPFPGLRSLYYGKLILNSMYVDDSSLQEFIQDEPELYKSLFRDAESEEFTCYIQLDAPLFNSLYMAAKGSGVKHGTIMETDNNRFLNRLLPLQDLMLFLASNWDAMRNVIKYLHNNFNSSYMSINDSERLRDDIKTLYKGAIRELLGTINPSVLDALAINTTSWLDKDIKESAIPAGGGDDAEDE